MKRPQLFLLAVSANLASAQQPLTAPVMRDVVTHQQLAQELDQARQLDPMKRMKVSNGDDPSVSSGSRDLFSQSDIICFNGVATLVPKHALLAAPENLKKRLTMSPGARIVGWLEFYAANRGWITTQEVSFAQAQGKQPLPEAAAQRIVKSTNLVVATFSGGPISVLPAVPSSPLPVVQK